MYDVGSLIEKDKVIIYFINCDDYDEEGRYRNDIAGTHDEEIEMVFYFNGKYEVFEYVQEESIDELKALLSYKKLNEQHPETVELMKNVYNQIIEKRKKEAEQEEWEKAHFIIKTAKIARFGYTGLFENGWHFYFEFHKDKTRITANKGGSWKYFYEGTEEYSDLIKQIELLVN